MLAAVIATAALLATPAHARPTGAPAMHHPTRVELLAHRVHRLELLAARQARAIRRLLRQSAQASASSSGPTLPPDPSSAGAAVPAWFASGIDCIGIHEESGHNSSAGYFGFVYPPSSYGESGYGESWLDWPRSAQVLVAWHLYGRYGWSPWSTAGACGL